MSVISKSKAELIAENLVGLYKELADVNKSIEKDTEQLTAYCKAQKEPIKELGELRVSLDKTQPSFKGEKENKVNFLKKLKTKYKKWAPQLSVILKNINSENPDQELEDLMEEYSISIEQTRKYKFKLK